MGHPILGMSIWFPACWSGALGRAGLAVQSSSPVPGIRPLAPEEDGERRELGLGLVWPGAWGGAVVVGHKSSSIHPSVPAEGVGKEATTDRAPEGVGSEEVENGKCRHPLEGA